MIKDTLHLKSPGNWINDPNGFIYYKGKYHLFYQYFPYLPEWGTMHWGHAVSEDLVHWEHLGVALFPTKEYDKNGIFSGSAIEKDGKLYLYYSAVKYLETDEEDILRAKDEKFETSQAMIISKDGYSFDNMNNKKKIIPVIHDENIADATHTRDPKVWKYKDGYYMILGSTISREKGRILFYKSQDAVNWEYVCQYENEDFGSVLECPDLFEIDGQYILQASPMDIMKDGMEYAHQSICAPVSFTEEECRISMDKGYQFVDYGLDLYAPQTNPDKEGNRVMIAWARMPKPVKEKSERSIWNGMMCIPRMMEIKDGHIYFKVHPEINAYMSKKVNSIENIDFTKPFRLKTQLKEGEILNIGGYKIFIEDGCVKADRGQVFKGIENIRNINSTPKLDGPCKLDIFVEPNLIEVFVNDGIYVLSNVVYDLQKKIEGSIEELFIEAEV